MKKAIGHGQYPAMQQPSEVSLSGAQGEHFYARTVLFDVRHRYDCVLFTSTLRAEDPQMSMD